MKKYLLFICLLFISFIGIVKADYYPIYDATINIDDNYIRDENSNINNNLVPGATYDEESNTLTLDNVSISKLTVQDMGESFKLKLIGINTIKRIYVRGDIYSSNQAFFHTTYLHIIGDGTLVIRREAGYKEAIEIWNGRLIIDNTVNVILDKEEDYNYDPLIKVTSLSKSISHAVYLEDRDSVSGNTEFFRDVNVTNTSFTTVIFDEKIDYVKIFEKDSKKYVVQADDEHFNVAKNEIKTITYNDKTIRYVFDNQHLEHAVSYDSLEDIKEAGYVETNDSYDVYSFHVISLIDKYDSIGNKYWYSNQDKTVFKDTGLVIVENWEHPVVIPEDTITNKDLERKVYNHSVTEEVFMNKFKTYIALEGKNQKYILGGEGLSFRFDAPYSVFSDSGKVYLDGNLIDKYTSKEGSTIISLSGEYLDTLSLGEHTLSIEYSDGRTSSVLFTVSKPEETTTNNPKTGDNILTYISLLVISLFILIKKRSISNY